MAGQWQWWTDSNPVYTAPPAQALTAAQALANIVFPPNQSVAYQPTTPIPGSMMKPYIFPVAPPATVTAPPPAVPIPPKGPTPPQAGTIIAPGPQSPPMGVFGGGAGGMGAPTVTSALPAGTHAVAYSTTLAASGGVPPYTWSQTGLPAGLTLAGSTISGTVASAGTSSVHLTVTDSATPANTSTVIQSLVMA